MQESSRAKVKPVMTSCWVHFLPQTPMIPCPSQSSGGLNSVFWPEASEHLLHRLQRVDVSFTTQIEGTDYQHNSTNWSSITYTSVPNHQWNHFMTHTCIFYIIFLCKHNIFLYTKVIFVLNHNLARLRVNQKPKLPLWDQQRHVVLF